MFEVQSNMHRIKIGFGAFKWPSDGIIVDKPVDKCKLENWRLKNFILRSPERNIDSGTEEVYGHRVDWTVPVEDHK